MSNDFSHALNRMIATSGKSVTRIANLAGVDRSYLLRLTRGDKVAPSGATIVKLFMAIVADERLLAKDRTLIYGLSELMETAVLTEATQQLSGSRLTVGTVGK